MRAMVIFFFARVMRAAIVVSLTRKARAISAVVSPHTSRSVKAIRASSASAGWQQVNTSRSRSSGITSPSPSPMVAGSGTAVGWVDQQRQLAAQCAIAAQHVQGPPARCGGEPGARVAGDAPLGPGGERGDKGVLDAFLGDVEVPGYTH